ncbi:site-specific integrase [Variovorax paradoxus]|uniref:site-specific integrase n=1 Tax=Variovorax paradoxus TaxID=34073 RepID=UPI0021ABDEBF|nr:site-specific integrase [Variovorax paradoxus]UVH60493.1 site-specific integrase [Variovorax paradoxus]
MTEQAARDLLREGESPNTRASYRSAMRYWAAWFAATYEQPLRLPVPVAAVIRFIVDHADRTTPDGLRTEMPAALDQALVDGGHKAKLGTPALSTVVHRISVLSKAHQLAGATNPCADEAVRELLAKTRRAYARRGSTPHKQQALTKEPLDALLATCDESLRGMRDRALLLFAWATGGRRRSEVTTATMHNLRRVAPGAYLYTLTHSKTNQSGAQRPQDTKPLVGAASAAMDAWLEASGVTAGALFRRVRKGGNVGEALSAAAVRDIVQARCVLAGIEGEFSAHSLRSGFVTEAGRQNMPLAETMAMTGHQSVASVVGYFRAEASLASGIARLYDDTK